MLSLLPVVRRRLKALYEASYEVPAGTGPEGDRALGYVPEGLYGDQLAGIAGAGPVADRHVLVVIPCIDDVVAVVYAADIVALDDHLCLSGLLAVEPEGVLTVACRV